MYWRIILERHAKGFVKNVKGDIKSTAIGAISLVVVMILLIAIIPTVVTEVSNINTTSWNFTGDTGAISLLNLIPFVFIAGVIIYVLVRSLRMGGGD
jgi:hypothetical protein